MILEMYIDITFKQKEEADIKKQSKDELKLVISDDSKGFDVKDNLFQKNFDPLHRYIR